MSDNYEWVKSAKKALDWMIGEMTMPEWHRRRKGVVDYFRSIKRQMASGLDSDSILTKKGGAPSAVYDDWIAWYLYLIESIFERPGNDEPWQTNRIAPFFALIGRYLEDVKRMPGINERVKVLLSAKDNQPDNTLYEVAIAILYHRNGWKVEFLPARGGMKTPDMRVSKGDRDLWVECKRFAKVTGYAEEERRSWHERVYHLFNAMKIIGPPAYVDILFKVPLEDVDPVQLGGAYWAYREKGLARMGQTLKHELLDMTVYPIDLTRINKILQDSPTRLGSPLMLKILTGGYDMHGQYSTQLAPSGMEELAPDNDLYVLNEFCTGLSAAYVAKWDCMAERSLELKFKDIRKRLSEAVSQIPDTGSGIVHIGYETVSGPAVEVKRHASIQQTINSFNFANKRIKAVYCNALQLLSTAEGFDWAETVIFNENIPPPILDDRLILDLPGGKGSDSTHWEEDQEKRTR
ncbi:MAG: hypothetical protein P4L51_04030 [Puia sp.]|nr:hypothetical protein [Puia sp.]